MSGHGEHEDVKEIVKVNDILIEEVNTFIYIFLEMNSEESIESSVEQWKIILPLGVASCRASIQLVPYGAVNRNRVSIHQLPLYFPSHYMF
jgi:hypothetical protein